MLENYIFRQISTKLLPKTKSSTIVETVLGWGIQQKIVFNQWWTGFQPKRWRSSLQYLPSCIL